MFRFSRRAVFAALALSACTGVFSQPAYPDKPIRLVVPYPPGGFTDILGRLLSAQLQTRLGQTVVVDNKGGGGSTIGSAMVARAPADGYTLLLVAPDLAINESLMASRLSYDARKDFSPVIRAAWSPMVLVTHPSVPAKNVNEFLALAKARPGKINFASGGIGTGAHLALELFKTRAGVDVTHVPYKGNGPATSDLLGGQVSAMFLQYAVAKPHVAGGKLVMLATPSGKRSPAIPDVPTLAESGLPGFDVEPWFGIVAPAGTPTAIVNRLNAEIGKIMQQNDVKDLLASFGAAPSISSPQEFGKFIDSEVTRWAEVVKASGAKAE
ncbi:tripartite tricarboxylate transporter substrate binding protein [Limnohabitans sp. Rim8]|jgi:tripartite-type tricarboxylate transporter receptor subunit TctC|uniref:tripartite tricarboxylate transporter substrate binding protein n=1 Tax=Limnohabitans sp. Rim8 TaxID=1100718 RepID=UPI0025ED304B|nr:tripartite tricarboxylate transporter substrate binding protein [Limnohabitans sp. Rim8]